MRTRLILGNNLELEREITGQPLEQLLEIFDTTEEEPSFLNKPVGIRSPYAPKLENLP